MFMNETRSARTWTLLGLAALVFTVGVYSSRFVRKSAPEVGPFAMDADLRDAVAEPAVMPRPAPQGAAALIARGRPVSWFESPESRHAELDRQLLSSRRRRALAQSVSVQ